MASGCWWYYISKFTEFFDTFFFVMRKRYDQVSTLHVIHHGLMPASVWWGVKFTPGGHSSFFGFLNTFVHIFMYAYYMLAAMGPKVQKYLWWKKYLTLLQMVQFVLVMVHAFQLLIRNDCNYPIYFAYFIGAHAVLFYFLFSNFYKQAYKAKVRNIVHMEENNLTLFFILYSKIKRLLLKNWKQTNNLTTITTTLTVKCHRTNQFHRNWMRTLFGSGSLLDPAINIDEKSFQKPYLVEEKCML